MVWRFRIYRQVTIAFFRHRKHVLCFYAGQEYSQYGIGVKSIDRAFNDRSILFYGRRCDDRSALSFSITMSMASFILALNRKADQEGGSLWRYLFFVGLGLSLLSKGPVGVPFFNAFPILLWTAFMKKWDRFFALFHGEWVF